MPAKKPNKPAIEIRDYDHADAVLREACVDAARLSRVEGELNAELTAVRERYEAVITELRARLEAAKASLERFAASRMADFAAARTRDLVHGRIGWRLTPPAVKPINRKWTWASVLDVIEGAGRKLAHWVRVKREVDKEAILADYAASRVGDTDLAAVGLRIAQDEQFVLDLNLDSVR